MDNNDNPDHVLVVDDDGDSRRMMRSFLEAIGHEVVEAEDGYEAVEKALAEHPDHRLGAQVGEQANVPRAGADPIEDLGGERQDLGMELAIGEPGVTRACQGKPLRDRRRYPGEPSGGRAIEVVLRPRRHQDLGRGCRE